MMELLLWLMGKFGVLFPMSSHCFWYGSSREIPELIFLVITLGLS